MQKKNVRFCARGEVYESLNPVIINGKKVEADLLIVQNDIGNRFSPTTITVPILKKNGKIQIIFDRIDTIDKSYLGKCKGEFSKKQMEHVDEKIVSKIVKSGKIKLEETIQFYEDTIDLAKEKNQTENFIKELNKILKPIKEKYIKLYVS